ncbi:MAG TPA: hypothetical protein VJU18_03110, partial [Vicinamibacteria bacterium]|nr:hypothetical protein [Vicinamibacteria bacterium]
EAAARTAEKKKPRRHSYAVNIQKNNGQTIWTELAESGDGTVAEIAAVADNWAIYPWVTFDLIPRPDASGDTSWETDWCDHEDNGLEERSLMFVADLSDDEKDELNVLMGGRPRGTSSFPEDEPGGMEGEAAHRPAGKRIGLPIRSAFAKRRAYMSQEEVAAVRVPSGTLFKITGQQVVGIYKDRNNALSPGETYQLLMDYPVSGTMTLAWGEAPPASRGKDYGSPETITVWREDLLANARVVGKHEDWGGLEGEAGVRGRWTSRRAAVNVGFIIWKREFYDGEAEVREADDVDGGFMTPEAAAAECKRYGIKPATYKGAAIEGWASDWSDGNPSVAFEATLAPAGESPELDVDPDLLNRFNVALGGQPLWGGGEGPLEGEAGLRTAGRKLLKNITIWPLNFDSVGGVADRGWEVEVIGPAQRNGLDGIAFRIEGVVPDLWSLTQELAPALGLDEAALTGLTQTQDPRPLEGEASAGIVKNCKAASRLWAVFGEPHDEFLGFFHRETAEQAEAAAEAVFGPIEPALQRDYAYNAVPAEDVTPDQLGAPVRGPLEGEGAVRARWISRRAEDRTVNQVTLLKPLIVKCVGGGREYHDVRSLPAGSDLWIVDASGPRGQVMFHARMPEGHRAPGDPHGWCGTYMVRADVLAEAVGAEGVSGMRHDVGGMEGEGSVRGRWTGRRAVRYEDLPERSRSQFRILTPADLKRHMDRHFPRSKYSKDLRDRTARTIAVHTNQYHDPKTGHSEFYEDTPRWIRLLDKELDWELGILPGGDVDAPLEGEAAARLPEVGEVWLLHLDLLARDRAMANEFVLRAGRHVVVDWAGHGYVHLSEMEGDLYALHAAVYLRQFLEAAVPATANRTDSRAPLEGEAGLNHLTPGVKLAADRPHAWGTTTEIRVLTKPLNVRPINGQEFGPDFDLPAGTRFEVFDVLRGLCGLSVAGDDRTLWADDRITLESSELVGRGDRQHEQGLEGEAVVRGRWQRRRAGRADYGIQYGQVVRFHRDIPGKRMWPAPAADVVLPPGDYRISGLQASTYDAGERVILAPVSAISKDKASAYYTAPAYVIEEFGTMVSSDEARGLEGEAAARPRRLTHAIRAWQAEGTGVYVDLRAGTAVTVTGLREAGRGDPPHATFIAENYPILLACDIYTLQVAGVPVPEARRDDQAGGLEGEATVRSRWTDRRAADEDAGGVTVERVFWNDKDSGWFDWHWNYDPSVSLAGEFFASGQNLGDLSERFPVA